jgi:hypothetical protein
MSLGKTMVFPRLSTQAPGTQAWSCRQRGGRYHNRDPVSTSSPSPKQRTETRARRRCRPLPTVEPRIGRAGPTNSPLTYGRTKKAHAGRLVRALPFLLPADRRERPSRRRKRDVETSSAGGGMNPANPPRPGEQFTVISSGYGHTFGVKEDGSVACWSSKRRNYPVSPMVS